VPLLVLDRPERGDDGRLLRRVPAGQVLDALDGWLGQSHQRSTSPRMKSMLPMIAITSASRTPCTSFLRGWRLQKDGGRTFIRYGFLGPSPTREKHTPPRGP